jgi:hypothetical protein
MDCFKNHIYRSSTAVLYPPRESVYDQSWINQNLKRPIFVNAYHA